MRKLRLIILFLLVVGVQLYGQFNQTKVFYEAGHRLERFVEKDGMMKTEISDILEDSKGYLWFANVGYLLKYDGYEFKKYKPTREQLLDGVATYFNHLIEDKEGYIWCSAFRNGGLWRFNPRTEKFLSVRNENDHTTIHQHVVRKKSE